MRARPASDDGHHCHDNLLRHVVTCVQLRPSARDRTFALSGRLPLDRVRISSYMVGLL